MLSELQTVHRLETSLVLSETAHSILWNQQASRQGHATDGNMHFDKTTLYLLGCLRGMAFHCIM